jgi:hypothetical protein
MLKEGKLYLNSDGRLAIDDWTYFTCGSAIELKICGQWIKTRIEGDGNGKYYAVGLKYKQSDLIGMIARVGTAERKEERKAKLPQRIYVVSIIENHITILQSFHYDLDKAQIMKECVRKVFEGCYVCLEAQEIK